MHGRWSVLLQGLLYTPVGHGAPAGLALPLLMRHVVVHAHVNSCYGVAQCFRFFYIAFRAINSWLLYIGKKVNGENEELIRILLGPTMYFLVSFSTPSHRPG